MRDSRHGVRGAMAIQKNKRRVRSGNREIQKLRRIFVGEKEGVE